jgi:hypothetical protein
MNRDDLDLFSADERDLLEQELLDLHFGCHEDPAALEARLAKEPALRSLQQDVLRMASLLEVAAKPQQPEIALRRPNVRRRRLQGPALRLVAAMAAAAAILLGFLVAHRLLDAELDAAQRGRLHVTVSGPAAVPAGAPWSFTVETRDLLGARVASRVRWQAFGDGPGALAAGEAAAAEGTATIAMAADLRAPQRVEVTAENGTDECKQVLALRTAAAAPMVHVSTDRPVYRPGDAVLVRAVALDRLTLLPRRHQVPVYARLLDAKGAPIGHELDHVAAETAGTACFSFAIPPESAGGVHKVEVGARDGSFPSEVAEVVVRPFVAPKLKKDVVLDRRSYAPGARGSAEIRAERMGGGAAAGAVVTAVLVLDGDKVWSQPGIALDASGRARVRFEVPQAVREGAARFVATIADGGVVETEVEPFVVPTGRVLVAAFPEGGELIAGVENTVYLECTDPLGRPVDGAGVVLDDRGDTVARFRTAHQGRAKVAFVPGANAGYRVQLAGQGEPQALPAVREHGVALQLLGDRIAAGANLRMKVHGRGSGPWLLGVFCRGVLVGQTTLRADERGELRATADVALPADAQGVLRATVFDQTLRPVAERLVHRAAARHVAVEIASKRATLAPGERQEVTVRTRDEAGRSIAANVGLTVADLAAVSLGSEPRIGLADCASLFADVERLEDVGDFFAGAAESPRNVDLLLGTRGWRRFVWRNDDAAKAAIAAHGDWAQGLLAREGFSQTPQVHSNLAAASAAVQPLQESARSSERRLHDAAMLVLCVLLLLAAGEAGAAVLRRTGATRVLPQMLGGAVAAGLLLFAVVVLRPGTIGGTGDTLEAAMPVADFAGGAGAAPPPGFDVFRVDGKPGEAPWVDDVSVVRRFAEDTDHAFGFAFHAENAAKEPVRDRIEAVAEPALVADLDGFGVDMRERAELAKVKALRRDVALRAYAHRRVANADHRGDFTPTICWQPLLRTNDAGEATVAFDTSDAVTTWTVHADAHAAAGGTGRVGQASARFATQLPFHLEPKLPDEISAGDRLLLPIAAIVEGDPTLAEVAVQATANAPLRVDGEGSLRIALRDGRGRVRLPVGADLGAGAAKLRLRGTAGRFTDDVAHELRIAPRGFPHARSFGGTVTAGSPASLRLSIPAEAIAGSGRLVLRLFPSPLSSLTQGLEGILQDPCGCFEQASSSNYPNTMVLTLLEASGDDVPAVAARARELLPRGYAKITGYECKQRGYEWFGGDPGHEALTAYGLLQFADMAKVHDVDAEMVQRTRQWLLARRDGRGGYGRNERALDTFGRAPLPITDAYVTYALLVSGMPAAELKTEVDALAARAAASGDAYELAVIACALAAANRPEAAAVRRHLATLQQTDGSLCGTSTSITGSGGRDLAVETTGFAMLAWLDEPEFAARTRSAAEFLLSCRSARGTFGATQATITALRALTRYAAATRTMRAPGSLRVFDGSRKLAERAFAAGQAEAIAFELWPLLAQGEHELRLELDGGGTALPWACDLGYHAELPADDPETKVAIRTSLRAASVAEGATVALDVEVRNRGAEGLPMTMAIVGLPAGLELPTKVLEDLQRANAFAFWELRGRELAIYWRDLAPAATKKVALDLVARIPGTSTGPASRAYLYYTPLQKRWAAPLAVEVTAAR